MSRYRKKPVEVQVFRLGHDCSPDWFNVAVLEGLITCHSTFRQPDVLTCALIKTLEGEMRADAGDWIIQGVKGEIYPCKDDIFNATYEQVL